jgi:hypothetical protein
MDTLIEYIADSSTRIVAVFTYPDQYIEDLLMAKSRKSDHLTESCGRMS